MIMAPGEIVVGLPFKGLGRMGSSGGCMENV